MEDKQSKAEKTEKPSVTEVKVKDTPKTEVKKDNTLKTVVIIAIVLLVLCCCCTVPFILIGRLAADKFDDLKDITTTDRPRITTRATTTTTAATRRPIVTKTPVVTKAKDLGQEYVDKVKGLIKFPNKLNEYIDWTGITYANNTVTMKMKSDSLNYTKDTESAIKQSTTSIVCGDAEMVKLLKENIHINYEITGADKNTVTIKFSKNDCPSN